MPTFIGLDLAWTLTNESGICWLEGESSDDLRCTRLACEARPTDALASEVAEARPAVVTIDAPLLYTSERWVENEIARRFGRYKVGAHQAHYAVRRGYTAGIDLGAALERRGFAAYPERLLSGERNGRYAVEVYPHTIHVVLFGLEERLLYKKGRAADKRAGLERYQRHLRTLIERECPRVLEHDDVRRALDPDTARQAKGAALKRLDDTLDGLTCGLAAWLIWSQPQRWELIGDRSGYIVAPQSG